MEHNSLKRYEDIFLYDSLRVKLVQQATRSSFGGFVREVLATILFSRYFRRGWRKEQYGSRGLDALLERTFSDFKLWKSYSLFAAMFWG